jgi:hypothetical protein
VAATDLQPFEICQPYAKSTSGFAGGSVVNFFRFVPGLLQGLIRLGAPIQRRLNAVMMRGLRPITQQQWEMSLFVEERRNESFPSRDLDNIRRALSTSASPTYFVSDG